MTWNWVQVMFPSQVNWQSDCRRWEEVFLTFRPAPGVCSLPSNAEFKNECICDYFCMSLWCGQRQLYTFVCLSSLLSVFLYFVDRASRYKFLVITNLMHFFTYLFISCVSTFRTSQRSLSGDRIVLIRNLVWLVCGSDCLVCWPGGRHTKQSLTHTNYTRLRINTIRSPDDERCDARNLQRLKINKYMTSAQVGYYQELAFCPDSCTFFLPYNTDFLCAHLMWPLWDLEDYQSNVFIAGV